jgi:hypothetical protein
MLMESFDKVWSEKVYEVYVCISAPFVFPNSRVLTIIGFVVVDFKFSNYAARKVNKVMHQPRIPRMLRIANPGSGGRTNQSRHLDASIKKLLFCLRRRLRIACTKYYRMLPT